MNKKVVVLKLLNENDQKIIDGLTLLTKMMFLYQQETETCLYTFTPGKYGPFSQDLYDDVLELYESGYINIYDQGGRLGKERNAYEITDTGQHVLQKIEKQTQQEVSSDHISELKSEWCDVDDLWKLLEHIHTEYPDMAKEPFIDSHP